MSFLRTRSDAAVEADAAAEADAACGCPTDVAGRIPQQRGINRRTMLKGIGAAGAAAAVGGSVLSSRLAYAADPTYTGDVLVVLSLRGGVDGLSVIPPVGDPAYAGLRPNIGIPSSLALPLGGVFGMHPALAPLKPFYDTGKLAVVHAVGQPTGSRSHFKDSEELERAAPGTSLRTGWLDRVLGVRGAGTAFQAVQLGSNMLPGSLLGPSPDLAMSSIDSFTLNVWDGYRPQVLAALSAMHAGVQHPVAQQAATTLAALSTAASMKTAGYTPANGAVYPTSALGKALRDLARLIKGNVGLQVATLDYGNWDMHNGLGRPGDANGWMHKQLADVAACLAAFATDLGAGLANVSLVTLTEFGRRAKENGDGGVDHGYGQAVLALGGGLRGGQVYGRWPGLAPANLDNGDLAVATDYRQILTEILQKRCRVGDVSGIFPGLAVAPLGLANAR
ncbi:MAG: hypothetical protein QOC98_527 [Frankiaceae bacterium]|nr:hypothetical protein [Frankiaceae bacterium]